MLTPRQLTIFVSRITLAILVCAVSDPAQAEEITIVNWDGSGVEAQMDLDPAEGPKKLTEFAYNFGFDEQTVWAPAENYSPPSGTSGVFGLALSSSVGQGPAVPHIMRLEKRSSGGTLTILIQGTEDLAPQMRGILFFLKGNFLSGETASEKVHFDAASRFSFMGILDGRAPEARWLVRDGETWFVSEATLSPQMTYNVSELRELENPESTKWAEYYVDGMPLEMAPTEFETRKFENITAVGIYWDSYGSSEIVGGTSISRMAVDSFSVQATK